MCVGGGGEFQGGQMPPHPPPLGEGECFDELFHFAANGLTEVGFQAYCQSSGAPGGGSASSRDGLVQRGAGASVESALSVDGDQCKGGGSSVNTNEVRNKPSGDIIGAKDTHILNGESMLSEDHTCDQANARAQQPYRGEGVVVGSGGATEDSVFRGRKNIGEDGMDGLEFEEGYREFGSSD